jgi:phage terminase large subunit-like protein
VATLGRSHKSASRGRKPTRGERNIKWIEDWCRVPEGRLIGQKVTLRDWQKRDICRIYDNPAGTRRAILSFGRKNGKTALAAFLLLLHLCGEEHRPNSQLFSAAQSRDQAALLFGLAAKVVRLNPLLDAGQGGCIVIRDTAKQLFCPVLGTLYRALSADASTAFGLSPVLVIHDELGQVRGPRSQLYEALETATGAQEEPLSIIISTQAPTDADLLSVLIDDGLAGHDPRVVVSLYTAPPDLADPFSEEALLAANPAFGDFLNAIEVLAMAEDARRMPARQAEFENLILNRRVEASAPLFSRIAWAACDAAVKPLDGVPVYGGLDLSEVNDLTALVLIGRVDGIWQVHPTFWLPGDTLADRARKDRVPYDLWHRDGLLMAAPGKSVDYEFVAEHLRGVCDRLDVRKIAFDRWGFKHLRPWLLKAGFTEAEIDEVFVEFGQGYQSMSPALRDLEAEVLNERIAHGGHPVLKMCAANAVVKSDPAGNRKLAKDKSSGRFDGVQALTMAVGVAPLEDGPEPEYQMIFLGAA